ncbi:MAG: arsenite methyltransferase [Candidatus Bathyarchaeota archaeon]|nr:arsenite methyltransferase [Candidatus Bathyarchaeota archaeon]
MTESETIKENVRERYAEVAKRAQASTTASCCAPSTASCCGPTSTGDYAKKIGYALNELSDLPDAAQLASAGCGNPTALASLKEGEVVLDLGSGGGIDVFIAAKKVGPTGKAIGVDMTQEMLDLATKNAEELGFENVEFRKGDIEDLPVEDGTIDVIISNCVINLAPDKDKVFREAYRVLKPGGRITVSDIVTDGDLPEEIRNNPDQWAACVSGALDEKLYLEKIRNAGFERVKVLDKRDFSGIVKSAEVEAFKPI